jgi:hypothetical protein
MKNNKKYFGEATAFVREKFSGVDGFNNFSEDELNFSNDYEAAGVNLHQYNSKTSMPYEIEVTNANLVTTQALIFGSFTNRTAANFGNVAGITIVSVTPNVSYVQMLASSEAKNFECGMTYIQAVSGSNAVVTATWSLTTGESAGEQTTRPLTPKLNPMQNLANVLEFYNTFKINGYCQIGVNIPASTVVRYSFYPSATVDPGRKLGNVPETREYAGPSISKPGQITLSPAALAALRG